MTILDSSFHTQGFSYENYPLSIVIPAYNEEGRLPKTLEKILSWNEISPVVVNEIIIVDDGSTDSTRQIVTHYIGVDERIKLVQGGHVGQMNAILTGFRSAQSPYLLNIDADCPINLSDIDTLVPLLERHDMVMGSRLLRGLPEIGSVTGKSFFRKTLSYGYSTLFRILFPVNIYDPQIGFKIYSKAAFDSIIESIRLPHDGLKSSEIVLRFFGGGYRIKECPINYAHDEDSRCVPKKFPIKIIYIIFINLFCMYSILKKDYKSGIVKRKCTRF